MPVHPTWPFLCLLCPGVAVPGHQRELEDPSALHVLVKQPLSLKKQNVATENLGPETPRGRGQHPGLAGVRKRPLHTSRTARPTLVRGRPIFPTKSPSPSRRQNAPECGQGAARWPQTGEREHTMAGPWPLATVPASRREKFTGARGPLTKATRNNDAAALQTTLPPLRSGGLSP